MNTSPEALKAGGDSASIPSHLSACLPQGQELTIRQISLLGFRDLVLLKVKLGDSLLLAQSRLPSSVIQMLLILQVSAGEACPLCHKQRNNLAVMEVGSRANAVQSG